MKKADTFDNTSANLADLSSQLKQREAEISLIKSVQEAMAAAVDMQGIYDLVGNEIRDLFDAQVVGIYTLDGDKKMEYFHYLYEDGERIFPAPRPLDKIRKLLLETKALILIDENLTQKVAEITGIPAQAVPGTRIPKSLLFVPMLVRGNIKGYVSIQNLDKEHAFKPSDIQLLSTLANTLSSALENARLFNETEQRNAELAVINSIQGGLAAEMDIQGIYNLVGDKIRDLFDSQVTALSSFDKETGIEHFHYLFEDGERLYPDSRPLNPIRKWIIKNSTLLLVSEDADNIIFKITGEEHVAVPGTRLPKSMLFVPLKLSDEVKGCVSLQNLDKENAFSESDVQLLSTISNSMSVALENARLFNETEQRNAELAVINSVQQGLVAEMDLQGIYDLVGDKIRMLFDAQVAAIGIFNFENQTEEFKYLFEAGERMTAKPRPYDGIRQRLISTKKLINIEDNAEEAFTTITGKSPNAVPGTQFPKSMVFVPLLLGEQVKGYVSLQNLDKEYAFSPSDVRLLNTLANSMSVALENARLFNETEQRNAELAVINSVQQGLVAEMDMQGIYNLVGDRIRKLFDAQVTAVATFNYENNTEEFHYIFEDGKHFNLDPRPIDKFRQHIINTQEVICINENIDEVWTQLTGENPTVIPGTQFTKSALYVPMMVGKEVRGYVSLQNVDKENAFPESDIRLLSTLANSMTVALENARLFNETEQRNAELAVINSVQEGLVSEMDVQGIYNLVGDRLRDLFDAQAVVIATLFPKEKKEEFNYIYESGARHYPEARSYNKIRQKLIDTREVICINKDASKSAKVVPGTKEPKSMLFVPLIISDVVEGYISLQNIDRENAFSDSDIRFLSTLANSMTVTLENTRLFNETKRLLAETEQWATEMQTVNHISRALVAQLEFDTLINLVGEQMKDTFKADIVYLAIHDQENGMLHFPYTYGDYAASRPFGNGITEKIITTQEPLLINQNLDKAYERLKAEKKGKTVESYLGVPILSGKKSIGVLSVQSTEQENRFNENDLRLLTTIAANLGIAIQNAEAYRKLQAALIDLRAAQEQLVQQEKLASLGQLAAGIAHEIKNPLNFVNNFSELNIELIDEIVEELAQLEKNDTIAGVYEILTDVRTNLKKIHQHGTRADSIVKSMLQHSRGGSGIIEPTDLNELIKEYVNLAFHGMRAGKKVMNVSIDLQLDEKLGLVPIIGEDFSRVILNLCNNAFDAMWEKMRSVADYSPKLTVRTFKDKNYHIEVTDNGPGIPKEYADKVLQPFFTTKKGTDGTGLGLSITNDIIKAHRGELAIDTQSGKDSYTKFKIELPK